MINGFNKFGTGVTVVITVLTAIAVFQQITGIMFPVFDVMSTVDPDLGMTPLNNGLLVCGQIGIVLIGASPWWSGSPVPSAAPVQAGRRPGHE